MPARKPTSARRCSACSIVKSLLPREFQCPRPECPRRFDSPMNWHLFFKLEGASEKYAAARAAQNARAEESRR